MSTGVICVQTLRLCARTCPSQNIKWWGLEKKLDHRRDFCRTLAPLLPHAHIIPPDTSQLRLQIRRGGNTEAWWSELELTWPTATRPRPPSPGPGSHPWPGSDLQRPGVTDTEHSPSSPATIPYSASPLAPQQSSKYCKILGDKDKTTGSFTINILKILAYCCTI